MKNIDLSRLTQESWPTQRNALVELFGTQEYGTVPSGWASSVVWEKELEQDGLHGKLGRIIPKTAAKGAKHYEPGDLVEHKVFGRGQVVAVKPAAGDQIVEINFEKVGIKKTMANFAPLTKITAEE